MSSFLCFVCHSTVNADTNEDTREKYREVIGMNLCPDSHLCYICCYFLNKLWMFKSICLKRSLEYPVLFSEKGTINLHRSETSVSFLCPEDMCIQHLNTRFHFYNNNENSQSDFGDNNYCELQDDRNFDINDTLLKTAPIENFRNEDYLFVTKDNIDDNLFNEELILPNLEPVRITQNDLVNGEWTQNVQKRSNNKNSTLIELNSCKSDINIEGLVIPEGNSESIAINNINNDNNVSMVMGIDGKGVIECPDTQHLQEVITSLNYPVNGYEQVENCVNENIENSLFEDQSNNAEGNINEHVSSINDHTPNVANVDNSTDNNLHITSTNDNVDYVNHNITNDDDNVSHINDNIAKTNDNKSGTNDSEININEIIKIETQTDEEHSETDNPSNEIIKNDTQTDEEHSETDNPSDIDEDSESTEKKPILKKSKKDLFEKIILTVEEQKMELEKARKDEKYITASYKCHSCAMYFNFKDTYQTHMMRHEESNGEFFCSVCSLRFASPAVLRSHSANHRVRYQCRACGGAVRARQWATHARCCAGALQPVNCHLCGRIFQSAQHFQQHVRRYHNSGSLRRYLCNVCGKSYDTRPHLRTHIITHINRKFECDQCSSTFSSPYTLNQHKKSKHVTKAPEVHHCTTCKITYNSRKSLLAHLRNALAHQERVYSCGACGRACPSLGALERHTAAVHTRSKHLACSVCQKRYSTTKALVRHMASHKEGRPVPLCHSCGTTFKRTSILKRHLKNVCEKDTRKCRIIDEELLQQVPYFE